MEIGTLLLMVGLAYAFGVLWYTLLPGKLPERVWRVAAYPFLGIFVAEALLPRVYASDPTFGGMHLVASAAGSLIAVIIDWIIVQARRPSVVAQLEPRTT